MSNPGALARLLQILVLGLIAVVLAATVLAVSLGHPLLAVVIVGTVASGHAVVLAVEFILAARENGKPRSGLPAGPAQRLRAWAHEAYVAPQVFCWQQAFRSRRYPNRLPRSPAGRTGILLVHGYVCNRGVWNPWLARIRQLGIPYVAVNLEPVFGAIDDYVPIIERAARRLERATGARPLIVAHSMGGLAVRAWLDAHGADDRVRHVVTVGTPHHGTALARFGFSANAKQMQPGSRWLQALAGREPRARYARFTCFYSHCDNIVAPAASATLPGADNRHVAGAAHLDMLRSDAVFREVLRWAKSVTAEPG